MEDKVEQNVQEVVPPVQEAVPPVQQEEGNSAEDIGDIIEEEPEHDVPVWNVGYLPVINEEWSEDEDWGDDVEGCSQPQENWARGWYGDPEHVVDWSEDQNIAWEDVEDWGEEAEYYQQNDEQGNQDRAVCVADEIVQDDKVAEEIFFNALEDIKFLWN